MLQLLENPTVSLVSGIQALDDEGFIVDPYSWDRAFSVKQALKEDIELGDKHWQVIDLIRDKYLRLGALPPMRLVCRSVGFERQELKSQFGSCLHLWKIAGLPHPGQEAISYMN